MVFIKFPDPTFCKSCAPCINSLNFVVIDPAQCSGGAENYFSSCPADCALEYLFGLTLRSAEWWKLLGSASRAEHRVVETSGSASC